MGHANLEVRQGRRSEVYRDIARLPEAHRIDRDGNRIPEGRICKMSVRGKRILLSLRGQQDHSDAAIC